MLGRRLGLGFGLASLVVAPLAYWASVPRIGSATRAEVLALVPKELREAPPRDLAAEARFRKAQELVELGDGSRPLSPSLVRRLDALVAAGPWRVPPGPKGDHEGPAFYPDDTLVHPIAQAARRGDRKACAAAARLAILFIVRYERAGGDGTDAWSFEDMLARTADGLEKAARLHALRRDDRTRLLALVPADLGAHAVADEIVHDFRETKLPRLLRAAQGPEAFKALAAELSESDEMPLPALDPGTFDPLETTRLSVLQVQAAREARFGRRDPALEASLKALQDGLPQDLPAGSGAVREFLHRCAVNHGRNTIGREWALGRESTPGPDAYAERAKLWGRIRAALSKA